MSSMRTSILWVGVIIAAWGFNEGSCMRRQLSTPEKENILLSEQTKHDNQSLTKRIQHNSTVIQTRISYGKKASIEKHPFMASLVYYNTTKMHFCGCAIIGSIWVLSAATCFVNAQQNITKHDLKNQKVNVHSDSANWKKGMYRKHAVIRFHLHKKFHYGSLDYDVAVVKVDPPFSGKHEKCAPLADANFHAKGYSLAGFSGWGEVEEGHHFVEELQHAALHIGPEKDCKELLNQHNFDLTSRMQCLVGWLTGVCIGDRGGPLTQKGKIIGIASFIWTRCGLEPVSLTVFTKISRVLDFIHKIAGNSPCNNID